ncbi:hypothetical protein GPOL_c41300 [Gordonia polyisoprenivorans VH2]|uniref:Ferredoxin n=1 Tax=Gordonia polyisoprenivorans (strain DSM 44266 / VH2) TaxID=1112204 RepID=H6MT16_GORPV|nr:hypothetical protein [Gordonia polyisoprenivorans]AFA75137.1 hypothetical protein GPOL_c41300 [Gordonia polyisoprenivorans VH2]OZC34264.1 hypothetical protein CJJ17_11730 [Gordonia polyisoprenivorans]HCS56371.1 hypothetical protein [Gordonia polyisoprenivorans]
MRELRCTECTVAVLVEKYSPSHTSVQWLEDAGDTCPEFHRRLVAGENSAAIPTCHALRDTIEQAARSGVLATDTRRVEPVRGRLR